MKKIIDHIVWAVQDLEAVKAAWEGLGFQATPQGVHPFGTVNHLLMADRFFVELLTVADATKVIPNTETQLSFSALNQAFLAEQEGVSMIVLSSEDAVADVAAYQAMGLQAYPPIYFSRGISLPDGSRAEVAFSIAFVVAPELPQLSFFVCQHHYPMHFWKAAYQQHTNTFLGLKALELVVSTPEKHQVFFSKLLGTSVKQVGGIYNFATPAQDILLMNAHTFYERNGLRVNVHQQVVQLLVFRVQQLAHLSTLLRQTTFVLERKEENYCLLHDPVSKIWLRFEP